MRQQESENSLMGWVHDLKSFGYGLNAGPHHWASSLGLVALGDHWARLLIESTEFFEGYRERMMSSRQWFSNPYAHGVIMPCPFLIVLLNAAVDFAGLAGRTGGIGAGVAGGQLGQ